MTKGAFNVRLVWMTCLLAGCALDAKPNGPLIRVSQPIDASAWPPLGHSEMAGDPDGGSASSIDAGGARSSSDAAVGRVDEPRADAAASGGAPHVAGNASGAGTGGVIAGANAGHAGSAACMPVLRSDCCDANSMLGGGCVCPPERDSDRDGLADCLDPAPFGWKKRITLDGAQVSEALADFPLLVRVRDMQLATSVPGGGADIHFTAEDGRTALDHELERFDATSGELVAWVRMPALRPGVDTVLTLQYGDGHSDARDATGVWTGYQYAWHLGQDPSVAGDGTIKDSTRHADATSEGSMTSADRVRAIAGDGIAFDGRDDRLSFHNGFVGMGASSIGAWVNQLPDSGDNGAMVISFGSEAKDQARFLLSLDSTSGASAVGFYSDDLTGPAVTQNRWSYVVWTWDGTNSSIYIDGARTSGPTAHAGGSTSGEAGTIGSSIFSRPRYLLGQLDEVRVAPRVLSSGWIAAEYQNQRPDSTFIKAIDAQVPNSGKD